jgi:hypothetical protein
MTTSKDGAPANGSASETMTESELEVSKDFFAMLGTAVFAACQLQYRLAHLYAVTFDTPRDASRPRVEEKLRTGLAESFGTLVGLAESNGSLGGELLHEVQFALELRDYIVHRLFAGTRSQHNESRFPELAGRLKEALTLFKHVEGQIAERHDRILREHLAFRGISPDVLDAHQRPWDQLEDDPVEPYQHRPAKHEEIARAWIAPGDAGPQLVLESTAGKLWQIAENGLAHFPADRDASWTEEALLAKHLPATVKSRPSPDANPPELRASFEYDLRLPASGLALRVSRRDAASIHYEIVHSGKVK